MFTLIGSNSNQSQFTKKNSKRWILEGMRERNISRRKPNKPLAIKNDDRVIRIKDYLQNSCAVRTYFLDTYGIDLLTPPPPPTGIKCPYTEMKAQVKKRFL